MMTNTLKEAYSESSTAAKAGYGLLVLLILLGLIAFLRQQLVGEVVTDLQNVAPWGIYITGFVFFVGASAGATIIGLMVHGFGREQYAPLATRALLVGLLSLVAAVTFIAVDVGRIDRMIQVPFIWHNPTSMFTWTSTTYYMFGIILVLELVYTLRLNRGVATESDKKKAKWLAIIAVPFALGVLHAPHGALFAVVKAREFWNNPLLPPHFATVALVSGTAIMVLVAIVTSKARGKELVSRATLAHMGLMLGFFIAVAALMDLFDFIVFSYSDLPEGNEAAHFLSGQHLPLSIIHVGGYIAAFLILLSKKGREAPRLTWAAALTVAAVAAYRINLTIVGLGVPLLPFMPEVHYFPSIVEIAITAAIIAGIMLAYSILVRVLPMEEDAEAVPATTTREQEGAGPPREQTATT